MTGACDVCGELADLGVIGALRTLTSPVPTCRLPFGLARAYAVVTRAYEREAAPWRYATVLLRALLG